MISYQIIKFYIQISNQTLLKKAMISRQSKNSSTMQMIKIYDINQVTFVKLVQQRKKQLFLLNIGQTLVLLVRIRKIQRINLKNKKFKFIDYLVKYYYCDYYKLIKMAINLPVNNCIIQYLFLKVQYFIHIYLIKLFEIEIWDVPNRKFQKVPKQNLSTGPYIMSNKIVLLQIQYYHGRQSLKSIDQSTILKRRRTKEQITEQSSPTKIYK
ncbi:unnamed protein product [Paramecium octaurelia]|uniref:Uncharacterized protein n=1 Tax=Paramecium octaurelia TaxID=43137 RepID=A0A8S1TS23_PAROT|nr:unnamed protein product [Paramecium octaurelia]